MWLDLCWFHWMCWWGLTCYVDRVWIMQHTHTCLRYTIPGLSIDSALPYPTLPRGPPLATLAPKTYNFQTSAKFWSTRNLRHFCHNSKSYKLRWILKSYAYFEKLCFFDAQIRFQLQIPKSLQTPKSCFKIPNLASKS